MRDEQKNQHFVPSSFLRGFAIDLEDTLIWGYDKKYGKCTGKRSINKICSSKYYYEQLMPGGSKTQMLEDGLQKIDKVAIEIIRNLSKSRQLSSDDKGCLALYIGLLLTRGPSYRDGIHEFHRHSVQMILQNEFEAGRLPEPPPILKKYIVDGDLTSVIKTEILPHVSLQFVIDSAKMIGQSLCGKKWDIYCIESSDFFITSDTPVMFESIDPKENRSIGPAHSKSLILCPITKKMLIAARPYCKIDHSSYEFMPVKNGMVNKFNEFLCFYAQRFIYSPKQSEELLGYVKKAKRYSKKFMALRFNNTIIPQWDVFIEQSEEEI